VVPRPYGIHSVGSLGDGKNLFDDDPVTTSEMNASLEEGIIRRYARDEAGYGAITTP